MLSARQLEAFQAVAEQLHFTRAAKRLGVTQSALSQRIANLEGELNLTLFVRDRAGVRLTEEGAVLARYCRAREQLEEEALAELRAGGAGELAGPLRIGAYSSVARSVLVPALAGLVRDHPAVQVHLFVKEMRELPQLLRTGEADLIVLDHEVERGDLVRRVLGREENVLVESDRRGARVDRYLDHDPEDPTTAAFLRHQGRPAESLRRHYLDDIYGILDAVLAGWGRAVVPKHLALGTPGLRVLRGPKPLVNPVVLHHYAQPFYPRLLRTAVEELERNCPGLLAHPGP